MIPQLLQDSKKDSRRNREPGDMVRSGTRRGDVRFRRSRRFRDCLQSAGEQAVLVQGDSAAVEQGFQQLLQGFDGRAVLSGFSVSPGDSVSINGKP